MEYIKDGDLTYILNKYHDTQKPFDSFSRFIRNDAIFDPQTGLDGDALKQGILENDGCYAHLPRPVRKAHAFAYVLAHTRISCDVRDIFPAINAIDRPINATLVQGWRQEVFGKIIPAVEAKRHEMEINGVATCWPDYDHSVPVWERIFALGFSGLLAESRAARQAIATLTEEQSAFFDGIEITYTAILSFLTRLKEQALRQGSHKMASALAQLSVGAPTDFYGALLLDYLYFMLSEHIEGLQVRSLCHFDRLLFPFYQRDLDRGVSEEELRRTLAYFLLQFTAIGNYWNQPIFLGGERADGTSEVNELSYLFLDVYDKMGIYNPKVQLKVFDSTPREFCLLALDMIRRGHNCIVFVNDKTVRGALTRVGVPAEAARLADVKGCYEYSPQGSMSTGMNYVNLLKPMEYALHEGRDGVSGAPAGLKTPPVTDYPDFDAFLRAYLDQLAFVIDGVIDTVNAYEDYLAAINPQSMLSATYPSCLERGRDALGGGAAHNDSVISFGFLADVADALAMIKKKVFTERQLTLPTLVSALDANFEGHEPLRLALRADRDKYGNNRELPDTLAREIVAFVTARAVGRQNARVRGGKWNVSFHVARLSYTQAWLTAASANGRRRGEELSKNSSASMGMNREGATAAILSVTKIDATAFTGDFSLDLGLLPSAVRGEDGLAAMHGLLKTFLARGGHAMHINVFDADTLRDAQKHPERYADLQIRVCGWNVLWNDIKKEEQDGFIRQAESLI